MIVRDVHIVKVPIFKLFIRFHERHNWSGKDYFGYNTLLNFDAGCKITRQSKLIQWGKSCTKTLNPRFPFSWWHEH